MLLPFYTPSRSIEIRAIRYLKWNFAVSLDERNEHVRTGAVCSGFGKSATSAPLAVALLFVIFHDGSRGDFLGALAVSAGLFCAVFDVLILPLLFRANSSQVFASWHLHSPR